MRKLTSSFLSEAIYPSMTFVTC